MRLFTHVLMKRFLEGESLELDSKILIFYLLS